jgi:cytochrome P450
VFPEPGLFKPERWLRERADGTLEVNTDLPDPRALNFGFGRRVCPGQHIANNMLFASAVSLLATMNISRKIDAQGKPMPFNEEWTPGVLNMFVKFDCDIRPRDQHAINLVREAVDAGM